jgi:hypothetical protein
LPRYHAFKIAFILISAHAKIFKSKKGERSGFASYLAVVDA